MRESQAGAVISDSRRDARLMVGLSLYEIGAQVAVACITGLVDIVGAGDKKREKEDERKGP